MTIEEAKTELKSVTVALLAAAAKRILDLGEDYLTAMMNVRNTLPDLSDREDRLWKYVTGHSRVEEQLAALDRYSCAAVSMLAGTAAKRLPIAQLGVRYKGKQKIEITRPMLAEVVANFRKRDTGEVPIDYDHSIETAAGAGDAVPAAGWIKAIDDEPDGQGILWGAVQWTPKAARMIEAGEYKYISPVIDPNMRDNKTGNPQGWTLTSAALTNQPVLQGMPALVLSEAGGVGETRREGGTVDNEWGTIQEEIYGRVKQTMAAKGLGHAAALTALMLDDRDLWRRYQAARVRELGHGNFAQRGEQAGKVYAELGPLVREKMAASEGRMDYGRALTAVLSERPDVARRYKETMS